MKKRIRFLINTLEGGGAERVLVNLLKCLSEDKYEVSLVTVSGGVFSDEVPFFVKHHQIIKHQNWLYGLKKVLVYKMPSFLFNWFFLPGRYDIEIAFLQGFPTRMMAYKCNLRDKTYAFIHSDFSVNYSIANLYHNESECLKEYEKFTHTCFVSNSSLVGFEKRIGLLSNAMVIHNIIDFQELNRKSKELPFFSFSENVLRIVTVGRLAPVKAFERLIRIARKLKDCYPIQIVIIGEGSERTNLESLILENGVSTVVLPGFNLNPYAVMAQADVYVCSSLYEGYSTSVSEAVGLGIPVLSTECAGMHEILDSGDCGLIVENKEDALYFGLKELLDNPDLLRRLKKNASKEQARLLSMGKLGDYSKIL